MCECYNHSSFLWNQLVAAAASILRPAWWFVASGGSARPAPALFSLLNKERSSKVLLLLTFWRIFQAAAAPPVLDAKRSLLLLLKKEARRRHSAAAAVCKWAEPREWLHRTILPSWAKSVPALDLVHQNYGRESTHQWLSGYRYIRSDRWQLILDIWEILIIAWLGDCDLIKKII